MRKIRKDDEVFVLSGKDKGKRGKVLRVINKKKGGENSVRVVVEGINIIKKHVRPNPQVNEQGGIVQKESSIHVSNVALYNPVTKKPDRVKIKVLDDGRKVRVFKSNDEVVDI